MRLVYVERSVAAGTAERSPQKRDRAKASIAQERLRVSHKGLPIASPCQKGAKPQF